MTRSPRPSQAARRPGALYSIAPPALALVVSSPAIVAGLDGSADPVAVIGIVLVALSAAWILSAVGVKVAAAVAPVDGRPDRRRVADPTGAAATGPVALGRIEPARVPASEAIPGTPPDGPSSQQEGPLT